MDRYGSLEGVASARRNATFAETTTFRTGGPIDILVEPATVEELSQTVRILNAESIPYFMLGMGSNLLGSDAGFRGAAVRLKGELSDVSFEGETASAGAGYSLVRLANRAAREGLSGLEFACGIPGTVGGAARMNAGAYGVEIGRIVTEIGTILPDGKVEFLRGDEVEWQYRQGVESSRIIFTTKFKLFTQSIDKILNKMDNNMSSRRNSQPAGYSAGSVFRNPEGEKAYKLILESGLKGERIGGAFVSEKHANFILNDGTATSDDIFRLIRKAQKIVMDKFGFELRPEIRLIGEFSLDAD